VSDTDPNRDQFRELIEAHALGALDAEERAGLEAHLASGCASCAKALEEGRWLVSQLAYLAPAAEPSENLRRRLLQTVRAEAAENKRQAPVSTRPAIPWWMWGAVAAALLFALYNSWNAGRERSAIEATRQEVAKLIEEQQMAQQELALARREALILTDPKSVKIPMPAGKQGLPVLEATWHQSLGIVVTGRKLPVPSGNRTLQLWLIPKTPGGKPLPSLTLRPDADGRFDLLVAEPPEGIDGTKALAITEEPEGGSQQPSTTPIWVGAVGGK
jgi:hypothetical protein